MKHGFDNSRGLWTFTYLLAIINYPLTIFDESSNSHLIVDIKTYSLPLIRYIWFKYIRLFEFLYIKIFDWNLHLLTY